MTGSFYGYALLAAFCTMMLSNDFRRRVFGKDEIIYRVKSNNKFKYFYFVLGLTIPVVILLSAIYLDIDWIIRVLMVIISIEMTIIWAIIELTDVIVTETHIGKVWYTAYEQMEYYLTDTIKQETVLIYKRENKKRREMIGISADDVEPLKKIMVDKKVKRYSSR